MAQFPCDHSNHLFRGRALYFYPAVGSGQDFDRRRYRLCPDHAAGAQLWLRDRTCCEQDSDEASYDGQVRCAVCAEPVFRDARHFFCTAFVDVDGETVRRDFWAPVHLEHLPDVWEPFQKPGEAAQQALPPPLDPIDPGRNLTGSRRK
jgi:hypothetical protein